MQRAELAHRAEYYLLGFPVQIVTNSPLVLRAAEESWGEQSQYIGRSAICLRSSLIMPISEFAISSAVIVSRA